MIYKVPSKPKPFRDSAIAMSLCPAFPYKHLELTSSSSIYSPGGCISANVRFEPFFLSKFCICFANVSLQRAKALRKDAGYRSSQAGGDLLVKPQQKDVSHKKFPPTPAKIVRFPTHFCDDVSGSQA